MLDCQNKTVAVPNCRRPTADDQPAPILLDSPSTSSNRVSFDPKLRIKQISFNNGLPRKYKMKKFETKDKTVILDIAMRGAVKSKAKKYASMVVGRDSIVLKYKRRADIDADLRALGLRSKTYIENKILVAGIGYRETEESVAGYFSMFGDVEKAVLERNTKNFCTGKGTVTFTSNINTGQVFRLNNRILRVERIKKQMMNRTRLHISHMNKDINISRLRSVLKAAGFVPKNIRIDLVNGKNRGYGFIEFNTPEESEDFIEAFERVRPRLGDSSYVELSKEKPFINK